MRVHQLKALVFWCRDAKKALAFPKNSFSFSSSRTRRRKAVISASISRGSGRPSRAAWRRSRSSLTHRPTTDSPSPQPRATDAIVDPVSNTKDATSRRYSGVKRRRVPITGTSLSAGTHTRLTKCQQHKPNPRGRRTARGCCAPQTIVFACVQSTKRSKRAASIILELKVGDFATLSSGAFDSSFTTFKRMLRV